MLAEQLVREGNLAEALARLQEAVRKDPANAKYRVFLFQLLAVLGDWERAMTQLNVAGELDASTLAMVQTYREALRCEVLRAEVFAGHRSPLVFGQPQQWVALLIEALRLTAEGHYGQSQEVREQAFEAAPTSAGSVDEQRFAWIADADPRLGPVLEVIINGRYYWVPFENIATVRMEAPADLRDFVWMPAELTWANGGESVGLIPTRYAGSESHESPEIRLARRTEWVEREGGVYLGLGQRMLATDGGEYPLMDVRLITLDTAPQAPGAETPASSPTT